MTHFITKRSLIAIALVAVVFSIGFLSLSARSAKAQLSFVTETLTYTAGTGGTISGAASQSVVQGHNGTPVTAVPNHGYIFVSWNDNGSTNASRQDTNVRSPINAQASFSRYTVTATETLNYTAGTGGSLSVNGVVSGTNSQTVSVGSSGAVVIAVPDANYRFTQWSDGSTQNPRLDTGVNSSINVTAIFTYVPPVASYTLSYTAGSHTTLSGTVSQTVATGGNGTAITARPTLGFQFSQWSDGSTQNPRTDTHVMGNISVQAESVPMVVQPSTYTLTYTATAGGLINGTVPQTVTRGGNGQPVTAIASPGYVFSQWSDTGSTNPYRQDAGVLGPISAQAQFALAPVAPVVPTYNGGGGGGGGGGFVSLVTPNPSSTDSAPVANALGSGPCPANLTITDNLKAGAHDGQYFMYNGKTVTQVNVLQQQINRVLAASYNQAAGPVDGKFGLLTKTGVMRLQIALNQILKPNLLLKIDGIVGRFTKSALNNSCGGM